MPIVCRREESAAAEVQVIADAMAKEGAAPPQSGLGLAGMPGRRKLPVRRSMSAQGMTARPRARVERTPWQRHAGPGDLL